MRISNRPGGTRDKLAGPASAVRFLTRSRPGLILLGLAAAAATVAVPTSASASTVTSPVVGYTYVDGNTAPANTVDGFARHADGSVTPLAQAYASDDGRTCRDFLASYVNGKTENWLQGSGCHNGNGRWEIHTLKPWRQS